MSYKHIQQLHALFTAKEWKISDFTSQCPLLGSMLHYLFPTERPLRRPTALINFLAVFGRTLEPSPNSSTSSSVLGTKKGSSGILSSSAKPKLSETGRYACTVKKGEPSCISSFGKVQHTWDPKVYSIHKNTLLPPAVVYSEPQLLYKHLWQLLRLLVRFRFIMLSWKWRETILPDFGDGSSVLPNTCSNSV